MNKIVNHDVIMIPVESLQPHPLNRPATGINLEQVETLKTLIQQNGYNGSKPITVRRFGDGYQIIEGHHRWHATTELGYTELPCVIEDLDDIETNLRLLIGNQQEGNDPLDIGLNALETVVSQRGKTSDMSVTAFANRLGKSQAAISQAMLAGRVHKKFITQVMNLASLDYSIKREIGTAPEWLWIALGKLAIEGKWNKDTTRQMVGNYSESEPPPVWLNADTVAHALLSGILSIPELHRLYDYPEIVKVTDQDLRDEMMAALSNASISKLSEVQKIGNIYEQRQAERNAELRRIEQEKQRQIEQARERVARIRENCSLDEWKELTEEERDLLVIPNQDKQSTFNTQKGDSIEWAQHSWNPVTGCKHECSYCYARDIANQSKMAKSYPHGFEPSFRSNALMVPYHVKVPKEAEEDTRYRNVFTCSMADLFGRWVPAEWINAVLKTVRENPQWNFLFLTKFPNRLSEFDIPDNAWMGTTVDLQSRVANAEKAFEKVKCKVKWLSLEPMLEPLHFNRLDLFDWVVIGGASQSNKTPFWNPPFQWIADMVNDCRKANAKVYFKTNLLGNRILELPFQSKIKTDLIVAPKEFMYLGNKGTQNETVQTL